jgi:hypothetical protein
MDRRDMLTDGHAEFDHLIGVHLDLAVVGHREHFGERCRRRLGDRRHLHEPADVLLALGVGLRDAEGRGSEQQLLGAH